MKETKQYAEKALVITTTLTLLVAAFEIFMAYSNYRPGMNLPDIASYVTSNRYFYCLVLIVANLSLMPGAVMLYKESGVSLKDEIFEKRTLRRDIIYGLGALAATELLGLLYSCIVFKGRTDLAFQGAQTTIGIMIMEFVALTCVSGFCKEIFFRGFAKRFCAPVMGEMTAFLLFDLMFAILDWHNLGYSFVIGLIWIWAYKKTGHLIAPMIAHGGANLIGIFYLIIVNGGI